MERRGIGIRNGIRILLQTGAKQTSVQTLRLYQMIFNDHSGIIEEIIQPGNERIKFSSYLLQSLRDLIF